MAEPQDLLAAEKETARRTQRDNAREVSLCERSLHHIIDGFNRLDRPFTWEERSGTILSLATLANNSLRWSFEMLLKGYYSQANAMSRLAWESWLNGAYLHLYQDRPVNEWSDFTTRPKPWKMRELVAERASQSTTVDSEEFREGMQTIYTGYSGYSHPSEESLRVLITKRDGEAWLRLGPDYDGLLVHESTNFFCTAAAMVWTLFDLLSLDDAEYQDAGTRLRDDIATWRKDGVAAALIQKRTPNYTGR